MSSDSTALDPLADFQLLDEFLRQRIRPKPYTAAGRQALVRRYDLPTARIGSSVYVDLRAFAEQLHARALAPRRRRGPRVRLED